MSEVRDILVILAAFCVCVASVVWLEEAASGKTSPVDLRAVCATHHGVTQVLKTGFYPGAEKAVVVCRDGWVGGIKP